MATTKVPVSRQKGAPLPQPPEAARVGATRTSSKRSTALPADAADAEQRLAKAELARIVRGIVRERQADDRWTQAHAAKVLGIAAPDMSNLLRGKLAGFSQERLAHFLRVAAFA